MKFINCLILEFYSGVQGGLCNDATEVIRSQVQCIDALQKLGYRPLSVWWIGELSSIPSGCSVRINGRIDPHFEESSTGVGTGRSDLIPICIRPHSLSGKILSGLCLMS